MLGTLVFATAPGLALIGGRTRPWMIILAAMLFSLACWGLPNLEVNFEYLYPIAVASYAVTLLYGTQRRTRAGIQPEPLL